MASTPSQARASTGLLNTAPPPPSGGIGIQLLQAPVSLKNDPRARVYIIDHLSPGTTIQRVVAVSNTTTSVQKVSLYAGGAQVANDAFIPGPNNALAGWTTVGPSVVELKPGTSQNAQVTIAVPATAPSGESYAVVWAQVTTPGNGVDQVNRVGIRMYIDVGLGGNPPTTFTIGPLAVTRSKGGRLAITSTVRNTGQRAIDAHGTLALKYVDGPVTAGPYDLDRSPTILPLGSDAISVSLTSQLPPGDWQATLRVTADTVTHTQSGEISIDGQTATAVDLAASSRSDTPYVIGGTTAAALLAAGGAAAIYRRRRHRSRPAHHRAKRKTAPPSKSQPEPT